MESAYFHLYTNEKHSGTANANQAVVVKPGLDKRFGDILSADWPLLNGSADNAKVVGSVQGQFIKAVKVHDGDNDNYWDSSLIITFNDSKFKGSTLVVRGVLKYEGFEMAIVGGTGQFTLAQGIIRGKAVKRYDGGKIIELCIHVFYRAIEKPTQEYTLE